MKNFKIIIVAIAIAFVAVSCGKGSSVDAALSQIEKAMDKVEKNKTSMTEADWEALSADLEQPAKVLNDALESDQVSGLKKIKIAAVMVRYMAVAGEAALHTVTDELKLKMGESNDLLESIPAASELQEIIKSDELNESVQEIQKALEELQKIGE